MLFSIEIEIGLGEIVLGDHKQIHMHFTLIVENRNRKYIVSQGIAKDIAF